MKNGYLAKHLNVYILFLVKSSSIQAKLNSKDLIPGQQRMTEDLGALLPL